MNEISPLATLDLATISHMPAVYLAGSIDDATYRRFREHLSAIEPGADAVIHLSTLGGDPEIARTIADDIRLASLDRRLIFFGKTTVYSAGVTLMSVFPREARYLAKGTRLLIHERKMSKDLPLHGPLSTCLPLIEAALAEIEISQTIQAEGFEDLARGSWIDRAEIERRATSDWYLDAEEALDLGLVAAVL